jgi:glycosyltransferase involved in cell wall biosynthesis
MSSTYDPRRALLVRIIIAHSRLTAFGGGERVTLELLRRLGQRHEVELWAGRFDPSATFAELAAFPRRELPPYGWLFAWPRAGAVISQTLGSNLLALRHPGVICYLHSLRSPYLHGSRPDYMARRLVEYAALHRAAAVLTNSAYAATRAASVYGRVPEVLPPGADDALLALPETEGTYALCVSRLAPEKGVERLLRWCRELPLDLALVGDGPAPYVAHLRSLAGPRTRFAGPLTGSALAEAYARCRFLAFLPHEEEFGMAALEAMAAGKPVIASSGGGPAALVEDGRTGFVVSAREAFAARALTLAADDKLCRSLGRAARVAAQAYTWERFASRIEALCLAQVRSAS